MVKFLVSRGVDLSAKAGIANTPLDSAIQRRRDDIVEFLLDCQVGGEEEEDEGD
jgi:hypothetical protein